MNLYSLQIRTRLRRLRGNLTGEICPACGRKGRLLDAGHDWPEMFGEWELSPEWAARFRERESLACEWCGTNLRGRALAECLAGLMGKRVGVRPRSLDELCRHPLAGKLSVAEVNAAEGLHGPLSHLPGLHYSEYGGENSQDLTRLSYPDSSFDFLVTSDTLEHVPDVLAALSEIRRVLKAGGWHVFTVPVVLDRPTRVRAKVEGGRVVHLLPPSYHGGSKPDRLVFYEFGSDFPEACRRAGFETDVRTSVSNPAVAVFAAKRRAE